MTTVLLSRFTPSLLPPETLEAIFVQRQTLANRLVEIVRESVLTPNKHYALVVGPRGIGKTHLVSLLYHRIKADSELEDRLEIAWLREEEWGIASFLDLLMSILRAIHEENQDPDLRVAMSALLELTPEAAEQAAEDLLLKVTEGKTLLILTENLDDTFAAVGTAGQEKLRALLQTHPRFTIVATSQSLFNGVSVRTSPFYGFFETHHLRELSFEEAVTLLVRIAEEQNDEQLVASLKTPRGRARVRAVHHLAGGNPRIYVIFASFLSRESLDDLVAPFMRTLDDLTPYYQARMTHLSPQQRKIVEFLCDNRGAVPVAEIAQQNFLTSQTASNQLGKLRGMGYVTSHAEGRESFYELREPLMRLALQVKKQRAEPIRLFVDFLRLWYSREELSQKLEALSPDSTLERSHLLTAVESSSEDDQEPAVAACESAYRRAFQEEDWERALGITDELIDAFNFQIRSNHAVQLMILGEWNEGLQQLEAAIQEHGKKEVNFGECSIVRNLLIRTRDRSAWKRFIEAWLAVFEQQGAVALLGQGLVRSIRTLAITWMTPDDARSWLEIWRELGGHLEDLEVPLRLLDAAVRYRATEDRRLLLALAPEERGILAPLLELDEELKPLA